MGVYIRAEQQEWQPSSTCVAYYKLEDDFLDYSGNGYNLTNNGIVLGTTTDGYKGGQLGPNRYATTAGFDLSISNSQSQTRTIAFWTGCNTMVTGSRTTAIFLAFASQTDQNTGIGYTTYNYSTRGLGNPWGQGLGRWTSEQPKDIGVSLIDNNAMHSYVFTTDSTEFKMYKDGVLLSTTGVGWQIGQDTGFRIGQSMSAAGARSNNGYIRQVVIDSSVWTAQDVLDYHNGTV